MLTAKILQYLFNRCWQRLWNIWRKLVDAYDERKRPKKDEILVMKFSQDWIYETISELINSRVKSLSGINDTSNLLITTKFYMDKEQKVNLAVFLTDDSQINKLDLISNYYITKEYCDSPSQLIDKSTLLNYGVIKLSVDSCIKAVNDETIKKNNNF